MYPKGCRKYTHWMLPTALAVAMTLCGGLPQAFAIGPTGKIVGTGSCEKLPQELCRSSRDPV